MRDDSRSRRDFLKELGLAAGAGALGAAAAPGPAAAGERSGTAAPGEAGSSRGPYVRDGAAAEPVAVASANGLRATERALETLGEGGGTLEAVVGGVGLVEGDPEDMTVGRGGLPNAEGVVQLDSQVWHGPTRGAGAVAALEGFPHPARVAVAVMRYTDHVMLVGEGAADFAREYGFEEEDLLTDRARRVWLRWRARLSDEDDYLTPGESGEPIESFRDPGGPGARKRRERALREALREEGLAAGGVAGGGRGAPGRPWGTIHCSAVGPGGELSAATTTSGLFFKVPGRVGDSPLPGCGCYADPEVGAAGATGRGEAAIKTAGAHTVVEEMRRGAHPQDACLSALRRADAWTVEDRLLDDRGRPDFGLRYYAVDREGRVGSATMWSGGRFAANVAGDNRLRDSAHLYEEDEER